MLLEVPPVRSAVNELVGEYGGWLINERGLAVMTVLRYETSLAAF
jgi:hypothetical protein